MSGAVASCEESWLHRTYTENVQYSLKWNDPVSGKVSDTPRHGRLALDLENGEQSRKYLEETFWRAGWWTLREVLKQKRLDERAASLHKTHAAVQEFRHCLERALASTTSSAAMELGTTTHHEGSLARLHENRLSCVPGSVELSPHKTSSSRPYSGLTAFERCSISPRWVGSGTLCTNACGRP